jgi:hypothetical protein
MIVLAADTRPPFLTHLAYGGQVNVRSQDIASCAADRFPDSRLAHRPSYSQ